MGIVSKKWTMALVRDMSYYRLSRYSEFLKSNPGLTDRMLGLRLKQMIRDGLVQRSAQGDEIHYHLTSKGMDLLGVMAGLMSFGVNQLAEEVFEDGRPRTLNATYPHLNLDVLARVFRMAPAPTESSVAIERAESGA